MVARRLWTESELEFVMYLYFQLPFGKLHSRQPDIIRLAEKIDRTPSSVAMKLVSLASLDSKITQSGRVGLGNASALDRAVWNRFSSDWDKSVHNVENEFGSLPELSKPSDEVREPLREYVSPPTDRNSTRPALVDLRVGQQFFRNAVLANFDEKCCVTGLAERRILVASHIRPWSVDAANRLNPSNGLCLSATIDRAFDVGLISISSNLTVKVSESLRRHADSTTAHFFNTLDGLPISRPNKVSLLEEALDWHRTKIYREFDDVSHN